jgi:hypothetical protein
MMVRSGIFPHGKEGRRQTMRTPDEVAAMQHLHSWGWGTRRIAAEVGCNRETVQRYLAAGAWALCGGRQARGLERLPPGGGV